VGRGRQDAVSGEALGDGVEALAGDELFEDAGHDRRRHWVRGEHVEPLADGRLAGVGVRAGVGEDVAVGRAAAEKPALDGRL
jgi:hypothetical protein